MSIYFNKIAKLVVIAMTGLVFNAYSGNPILGGPSYVYKADNVTKLGRLLKITNVATWLYLTDSGGIRVVTPPEVYLMSVYFTTANCTGQGYQVKSSSSVSITGGYNPVYLSAAYQMVDRTAAPVTGFWSILNGNGTCDPSSGGQPFGVGELYPLVPYYYEACGAVQGQFCKIKPE